MEQCCNQSAQNLGQPICNGSLGAIRGVHFMPTYGSAGTLNKIAISSLTAGDGTANLAVFNALINNANRLDRLYPLPLMENIDATKAEPNYQSYDSGRKYMTDEGLRTFKAIIPFAHAQLVAKINSWQCQFVSAFLPTVEGGIICKTDGTNIYPIKISQTSIYAMLKFAKEGKEGQEIPISFDFDRTEKDDFVLLSTEELGFNSLNLMGLMDVTAVVSDITATGFSLALSTDFGTVMTPVMVRGMVKADCTYTKSGTPVTITSVTETQAGNYDFVVPTATGVHKLNISLAGFEIPEITVTHP